MSRKIMHNVLNLAFAERKYAERVITMCQGTTKVGTGRTGRISGSRPLACTRACPREYPKCGESDRDSEDTGFRLLHPMYR